MFIFRADDGTEQDVTEDVGCLYDLVIGSMDWGSGFLTVEDAMPVVRIAQLGGFKDWEAAQKYVSDQIQSTEQQEFLAKRLADRGGLARLARSGQFDPTTDAYNWLVYNRMSWADQRLMWEQGLPDPAWVPHDHVYSSVGRCMWRYCQAEIGKPDPRELRGREAT